MSARPFAAAAFSLLLLCSCESQLVGARDQQSGGLDAALDSRPDSRPDSGPLDSTQDGPAPDQGVAADGAVQSVFRLEAESAALTGAWVREDAAAGFSGTAYYRWAGDNVYAQANITGDSVLTYTFTVPSEGEYLLNVRSRRDNSGEGSCRCSGDGDCADECNDLWIQINGEPWLKKMAAGPWNKWQDNVMWQYNDHPTGVSVAEAYLHAGANTIAIAGRSRDVKLDFIELTRAPKYQPGDLIAIHHDNAADIDDALAAAANFTIVSKLGLAPLVVNGAYGWQADTAVVCPVCGRRGQLVNSFNLNSLALMDDIWGAGNWLDAHGDWAGAVTSAATRWLATLQTGGTVWVVEAGQSDFTVAVVKQVRSRGFTNTRSAVRVIQHSLWNEEYTERGSSERGLAYLQYYQGGHATYVRIGDGNSSLAVDGYEDPSADRPTHTADLSMKASETDTASFRARAKSSACGAAWQSALSYFEDPANHNPNYPHPDYVDFSDTVELLYVLGIPVSRVGDLQDFADEFF